MKVRDAVVEPCECGHAWFDHDYGTGCCIDSLPNGPCLCDREPPDIDDERAAA